MDGPDRGSDEPRGKHADAGAGSVVRTNSGLGVREELRWRWLLLVRPAIGVAPSGGGHEGCGCAVRGWSCGIVGPLAGTGVPPGFCG